MAEATWIAEDNIVGDDRQVKQFEDEAHEQGIDLNTKTILFPDDMAAGWK